MTSYTPWTPELWTRAKAMYAAGIKPKKIDAELGLKPGATSHKIYRTSERARQLQEHQTKTRREVVGKAGVGKYDPPAAVSQDANERAAARLTMSPTAAICGDPAPGWSALERQQLNKGRGG